MTESNGQSAGRVFGLTRASTLGQVTSPDTQREIIGRACESLKLGVPQFLNEPLGTSGRSLKFAQRPMGLWALRNLRKGDTLIVTELRSVGRNFIDQYTTIDTLYTRGVRIIILKGWSGQSLDLSKTADKLFLAIHAFYAEEEGNLISERTRAGLQFRRDNGLATGKKQFYYIQAYSAAGQEIPPGQYNKLLGHHKRHLPDRQWLDQLCELLALQKHLRAKGFALYRYCEEKRFVTRDGWAWWRGTILQGKSGIYTAAISQTLKKVRRMAIFGQLPEEYNQRVLMITCDTPATVAPKWKRKVQVTAPTALSDAEMESWSAEQWQAWYQSQVRS